MGNAFAFHRELFSGLTQRYFQHHSVMQRILVLDGSLHSPAEPQVFTFPLQWLPCSRAPRVDKGPLEVANGCRWCWISVLSVKSVTSDLMLSGNHLCTPGKVLGRMPIPGVLLKSFHWDNLGAINQEVLDPHGDLVADGKLTSFQTSLWWSTLSKALLKSRKQASTLSPLSTCSKPVLVVGEPVCSFHELGLISRHNAPEIVQDERAF